MRWQPFQFVGGAYTDDATPWTAQDCVNYIPVMAEKAGARSPAMLRQAPGAAVFSTTGSDAPIRGLHNAEGLLLTVSAQTLYRIGTDGTATSIGTIPGVKRCSIAHNQITAGNQVAIANGSSGYIYNTTTAALTQITDDGFPGAKVFDFVDQYIVGVEPMGRFWFWSDLAAAGDYNTLDRAEAETAPDKIVTLIATHGEVFVLGERTSEFFYNTGAATGTFQRREAGMEVGCGAQHSVVRIDNSVVWLGHDGSVYRLQGYQPVRISTHQIEQAIGRCNWADAYAYTFEDAGHKIYYLTFTDGQTFGFDMATGEWHRRKSYGLDFWRMSHLVRWNRVWIAGDYTNGTLYNLDWRLNSEAGEPMERMRTLPPIHDHGNRLIVNALKLEIDTGKTDESFPLPAQLLPEPDPPLMFIAALTGVICGDLSGVNSDISPPALGAEPLIKYLDGELFYLSNANNYVRDSGGSWVALTGLPTGVDTARDIVKTSAGYIALYDADRYVYRSTDGRAFSQVDCAGVGNVMNANCIMQVGDTLCIDFASPSALDRKSTDGGLTWSNGTFRSGLANFNPAVASATNGSTVVAVGAYSDYNRVRVSTNGMASWSTVATPAVGSLGFTYVAHNGTRFLALKNSGHTVTSTSGASGWAAGPSLAVAVAGSFKSNRLSVYDGSFVMADRQASGGTAGAVAFATDGVAAWSNVTTSVGAVIGGTSIAATG